VVAVRLEGTELFLVTESLEEAYFSSWGCGFASALGDTVEVFE